jgi:hypothetical protein
VGYNPLIFHHKFSTLVRVKVTNALAYCGTELISTVKGLKIKARQRVHKTLFSLLLKNVSNKLECLITLYRRGLQGTSALAYFAHMKKIRCCEYGPQRRSFKTPCKDFYYKTFTMVTFV